MPGPYDGRLPQLLNILDSGLGSRNSILFLVLWRHITIQELKAEPSSDESGEEASGSDWITDDRPPSVASSDRVQSPEDDPEGHL